MGIRLPSVIYLLILSVAGVTCSPAANQDGTSAAESTTAAAAYIPPTISPESRNLTQADVAVVDSAADVPSWLATGEQVTPAALKISK